MNGSIAMLKRTVNSSKSPLLKSKFLFKHILECKTIHLTWDSCQRQAVKGQADRPEAVKAPLIMQRPAPMRL
ncbi:hypothetical protein TNCV_2337961 [Trichonephila clavipes]|nr:hypothetical protein TNCV_2337961 [Trichonephila clavipes]